MTDVLKNFYVCLQTADEAGFWTLKQCEVSLLSPLVTFQVGQWFIVAIS